MQFGNTKIGGMSFGSTKIGGAKYGNTLVFQPGGGVQPIMIPYIRGGADGSYIDTGIAPNNTTRIIVWARNFNPKGEFLFGSRDANAVQRFAVLHPSDAHVDSIRTDFGSNNTTFAKSVSTCSSGYHKYELNGNQFFLDDELLSTMPTSTFEGTYPIHLFGNNNTGSHSIPQFPIDICACKIYKNDVLVRDFTPVNSPSVGLYDAISDAVFTNAGSGSFTYGEFDGNAYTPLEYIECDGSQYFDTGVNGSYYLSIVSKLRSTNTTVNWMGYLGVFSSSPQSCCSFTFGNAEDRNAQLSFRLGATTGDRLIFSGSASNNLTDKDIVILKNNNIGYTYYNNTQIGTGTRSGVATTFRTNLTMYVGATRSGDSTTIDSPFIGRIYFVGLGTQRSLVPAKKGSLVGMYDTYNDVFYESATETPFIAGPTI